MKGVVSTFYRFNFCARFSYDKLQNKFSVLDANGKRLKVIAVTRNLSGGSFSLFLALPLH